MKPKATHANFQGTPVPAAKRKPQPKAKRKATARDYVAEFRAEVARVAKARGVATSKAVSIVVAENPALHKAMLMQSNIDRPGTHRAINRR